MNFDIKGVFSKQNSALKNYELPFRHRKVFLYSMASTPQFQTRAETFSYLMAALFKKSLRNEGSIIQRQPPKFYCN